MPPTVQRLCVLGSGPNRSPAGRAAACSDDWTTPGSTVAVRASASIACTRARYRLVSMTTPGPTALPAMDVPAPLTSGTLAGDRPGVEPHTFGVAGAGRPGPRRTRCRFRRGPATHEVGGS